MSSSYRLELDRWLSQLDVKAATVLDIGGSQLPVKGRTKSWDVERYFIADMKEPHVNSPKPQIELNLNAIIWDIPVIADLIFCLEVFDYVYHPVAAMQHIESMLISHGTAWVTFPTFYPTHNPVEDDALCYKEGGIRKLAAAAGLTIKHMIKRRPETDAIEQLWRRERMRAAKHYDHDFTGWICEFTK